MHLVGGVLGFMYYVGLGFGGRISNRGRIEWVVDGWMDGWWGVVWCAL